MKWCWGRLMRPSEHDLKKNQNNLQNLPCCKKLEAAAVKDFA